MPDLGRYAFEVLTAYGATILLLAGLVWATWARSKRVRRALEQATERHDNG